MIGLIIGMPYGQELAENPVQSITLTAFMSLFVVCVDIFVIISAWFEIHASTKGLMNLAFQCLFFAIVDYVLTFFLLDDAIPLAGLPKYLIHSLFPGWFIPAYIVLYLISPFINSFISNNTKERTKKLTCTMFLLVMLFGYAFNGCSGNGGTFLSGFSATFLIFLYTWVRYLKVHCSECILKRSKNFWLMLWISLIAVDVMIWYFSVSFDFVEIYSKIFLYTSPIVLLQSFSMFMFFYKLKLKSRFINWLGASSLAILLLHWACKGMIMKTGTMHVWNSTSGLLCIAELSGIILLISFSAILIDQLRIYIWHLIDKHIGMKYTYF